MTNLMELWGADTCKACVDVRNYLSRTPLEWKYVNVKDTGFEGEIPRLVFDDGHVIIGLVPIRNYVQQEIKRLGIPWM